MQKFKLQQNALQGNQPVEISFPDDWEVEYHGMEGDNEPAMTKQQILDVLNNPHGMKPLRELAVGRKEVVIVFDDNSRATPARPVAEAILEVLHDADIQKSQIRFLCALGTHGANNRRDFVEKLGEDIVRNYPVYNHNCYDNCVKLGTTSIGTEVMINKEFMDCDLRIGIGALTPHVYNAFGGGGKLLFPGLAAMDTVINNHRNTLAWMKEAAAIGAEVMGDMKIDVMRNEVEEMTRMVGEVFKVDCIYNTRLKLIDLYAGEAEAAYYAGVPSAKKNYAIDKPAKGKDIVVINANAKANEMGIALSLGSLCLREDGGDAVLVDYTTLGQVTHYLTGCFGKFIGGPLCNRDGSKGRKQVKRIICNMPYPNPADNFRLGEDEKQIYLDTWEETLALLKKDHGPDTTVSIICDGTISYFRK